MSKCVSRIYGGAKRVSRNVILGFWHIPHIVGAYTSLPPCLIKSALFLFLIICTQTFEQTCKIVRENYEYCKSRPQPIIKFQTQVFNKKWPVSLFHNCRSKHVKSGDRNNFRAINASLHRLSCNLLALAPGILRILNPKTPDSWKQVC